MTLLFFILVLVINIIGLLNHKRPWSKIYLMSQVFIFIGAITFYLLVINNNTKINELEAKGKFKAHPIDSIDTNIENNSGLLIKY